MMGHNVFTQARRSLGYVVTKRLSDVVFSIIVVVMLSIPVLVISLIIFLESPGNPLYVQERVGKGGKTIKIFKLRSMVADADNVEKYFSPEQLEAWQRERKVDFDPRITRVGGFIRKASLDELPQFVNVLIGDMSVIGPRTITRDELEQWYTDAERDVLLSVPQGITGWWQVQKRNDATFESGERQKLELHYATHADLRMDWDVFFATFGAILGGAGK